MSEFNITIKGGTSKRLPTAGKYVDRDIIVTAEGGGGSDTMVGIWILNEVLDLSEFDFYFNFVLTNVANSPQFYNFWSDGDGLYYVDVDDGELTPYYDGAWIYPDRRTITITEEPTDAECIAWLKANARKATYEDGFAEGGKAMLSTFVDWTVSTNSNSCIVEFYNDSIYYAHMYLYVQEAITGFTFEQEFVLAPQDVYSINEGEMGIHEQLDRADWLVNATIRRFSKDGEA